MTSSGRPRKCDPKVDSLRSDIRQNNYETAKSTLKEFGIDATDGDGRTALINSIIEKKKEFMEWLLENNADINHRDRKGYSPLHFAALNSHAEMLEYLLKKGANPNLQDQHGNSPLWTAIFNSMGGDISIVKLLLQYKADGALVNNYSATPNGLYKDRYGTELSSLNI